MAEGAEAGSAADALLDVLFVAAVPYLHTLAPTAAHLKAQMER